MNRVLAVAATIATILAALPAKADWRYRDDDWGRHYRYNRHHHYGPSFGPPIVVYRALPPRTVYVMPPPPMQAMPMSPTYTDSWGRYCREYQSTVIVGGMAQGSYGTACMQPDGSWQVVR